MDSLQLNSLRIQLLIKLIQIKSLGKYYVFKSREDISLKALEIFPSDYKFNRKIKKNRRIISNYL